MTSVNSSMISSGGKGRTGLYVFVRRRKGYWKVRSDSEQLLLRQKLRQNRADTARLRSGEERQKTL